MREDVAEEVTNFFAQFKTEEDANNNNLAELNDEEWEDDFAQLGDLAMAEVTDEDLQAFADFLAQLDSESLQRLTELVEIKTQ